MVRRIVEKLRRGGHLRKKTPGAQGAPGVDCVKLNVVAKSD
jgi:hypothetical protein